MKSDTSGLGAYLRAVRTRAKPDGLGLPARGRRRVPGLRREEIAQLAGVSVSYYTSLEQGRALHASPEVLHAIARALDLDDAEESHLLNLGTALRSRRRPRRRRPRPTPQLQALLDAMPDVPAVAHDSALDLLAWNRLGHALYAPYADREITEPPGRRPNLARMVFLDPWCRDFYVDWWAKAESLAAAMRITAGREPHDTALSDLIGELIVRSPDFERIWSRHRVRMPGTGAIELHHPQVGRLTVTQHALAGLAAPDTYLLLTTTEPGSTSREQLRLLSQLTAEPTSVRENSGAA